MHAQSSRFSRFDRLVFLVIALLLVAIGSLVWLAVRQTQVDAAPLPPAALFTTLDNDNREQIHVVPLALDPPGTPTAAVEPLTRQPGGIWDFAASPDGRTIVYSALNEDGTSDLWRLDRATGDDIALLDCPQAACANPTFSPDGRLLAFSRRNATEFSAPVVSPPRLWLLDMETGETAQVFADGQKLGFEPRWSGDAQWMSFVAPDPGGVGAYHLENGSELFFPSTTGEGGVWHPQRAEFLMTEMLQEGERYVTHLWLVSAETGARTDFSALHEYPVEDNQPSWSPDGAWIAFRRKELAGPRESLSKQLWLMRADGSEARPLTQNPDVDQGPMAWSPDGRFVLFHKFPLRGEDITISVWMMDVASGEQWQVAPGQRPLWLP
jgi:TolB protein